jgi:hypothetical protein
MAPIWLVERGIEEKVLEREEVEDKRLDLVDLRSQDMVWVIDELSERKCVCDWKMEEEWMKWKWWTYDERVVWEIDGVWYLGACGGQTRNE